MQWRQSHAAGAGSGGNVCYIKYIKRILPPSYTYRTPHVYHTCSSVGMHDMLVHTHTYAWNAARVVESRSGSLQRSYSYPKCVSPRVSFRQVQTGLYLRKANVVKLCSSAILCLCYVNAHFLLTAFYFCNFKHKVNNKQQGHERVCDMINVIYV